ncbi:hypothetical protein GBO17_12600 [Mycobacterium avium subsp. hominissuis]|uniref:hypothetical protein n=1 Tax=Mycobacterium avium TaxID=1764 RepID=UPI001CC791D5|nr:hypothetical protein [Mycobacterium avium]MBZ4569309.1 hypothetical protein [Mycobacterium avium subsp. hominissuis]MBZ4590310.1 hypothetical protein [Mycobacterium avium subsp. hominissuis]MBZ4627793.1 hypothetical protein [Mycobacterium avium subsp. hominissuis]
MRSLLEFFLRHLGFLYLDPRYHITGSTTSGDPMINASLTLTGPVISWEVTNDRGQVGFAIAPTPLAQSPDNWFRATLIRQYLDGYDETNVVSEDELVAWIRTNLGRMEQLFSAAEAAHSCEELLNLAKALAVKYFGPPEG